jgi:hypothetical protein
MGNSTLPTVSDKLNVMASIHNRKLIAVLSRDLKEKDVEIRELKQTVTSLENKLSCPFRRIHRSFNTCLTKVGDRGTRGTLQYTKR